MIHLGNLPDVRHGSLLTVCQEANVLDLRRRQDQLPVRLGVRMNSSKHHVILDFFSAAVHGGRGARTVPQSLRAPSFEKEVAATELFHEMLELLLLDFSRAVLVELLHQILDFCVLGRVRKAQVVKHRIDFGIVQKASTAVIELDESSIYPVRIALKLDQQFVRQQKGTVLFAFVQRRPGLFVGAVARKVRRHADDRVKPWERTLGQSLSGCSLPDLDSLRILVAVC
mmetsp:Transcript_28642/g.67298  ORF Transcript_28642/g.67298 Transcript_28642/m.67298 type:complete len:227 (+) Transcript_28642:1181-1861(+)